MKVVKTSCGLCPQGCGMNMHLKRGRVVKVEGMPEHPWNKGFLCPKGEVVPEWAYSPERLKYPLRKKDGKWCQISWDEALDLLVVKLAEIGREDPRAFAALHLGCPSCSLVR